MAQHILKRRGTSAEWSSVNPVLAPGEEGFETDTLRSKVGDGVATWSALPYQPSSDATSVPQTESVTFDAQGRVATSTVGGVVTAFTYNGDGSVNTETRLGKTKTYTYDSNKRVTGATVS